MPCRIRQFTTGLLVFRSNMPIWAWLHLFLVTIFQTWMLLIFSRQLFLARSQSGMACTCLLALHLHLVPSSARIYASLQGPEQLSVEPYYELPLPITRLRFSSITGWAAILCQLNGADCGGLFCRAIYARCMLRVMSSIIFFHSPHFAGLRLININLHRILRIRMGAHHLPTEVSCRLWLPLARHVCHMCWSGVMCDEQHVLLECSALVDLRVTPAPFIAESLGIMVKLVWADDQPFVCIYIIACLNRAEIH